MNKHLHRVIFNKARGQLMVVAENVSGQGKAPGTREAASLGPRRCVATLGGLRFALMAALGLVSLGITPAWAGGIVADPGAPGGQRPMVIDSANGTPQVNIQAPSAAGVSRNQYSQFDVDSRGAILNNASTNAQTQLGGWIQGNPNLANGSARVILNEVNASNPSQLRGYVEVAGQRAEVVIANPAGITCDGCGFINADRSTLTTGRAQLEDARIVGYRVEGGTLTITGKGLDARDSDYTDLIARSVKVNAGVWAKDLKVTTGRNQVTADNSQATALDDDGSAKPEVAIDVADLGGMYAGKIKLVGTEAGVGVRNAGQIGAMAGEVSVTADGRLVNQGAISSAGDTRIATGSGVDNSGSVYAKGAVQVSSAGTVDNSGTVAAQGDVALQAGKLNSSRDALLAAGVDSLGVSSGQAALRVDAQQIVDQGQNHASGAVTFKGESVDLSHGKTQGASLSLSAGSGDLDLRDATLDSAGTLQANTRATLRSDRSKVNVGQLQVDAASMSNVAGDLVQTGTGDSRIGVRDNLDNSNGRIASNAGNLTLDSGTFNNRQGTVEHAGSGQLAIDTRVLDSTAGTLASNGALALTTQQALLADSQVQGRNVSLDSPELDTRNANVIATQGGNLSVRNAQRLDNRGGTLAAGGNLDISAEQVRNDGGRLSAGAALNLRAERLDNLAGTVAATQAMQVIAARLDNTDGTLGSVQGGVRLDIADDALLNQRGRIEAAGLVQVSAKGIDNRQGTLSGGQLLLDSRGQTFDNDAGTLDAGATLDLRSGELRNSAGLIQAGGRLFVDTGSQVLRNTASGIDKGIVGQDAVELRSGQLLNDDGFIAGKGDVLLVAQQVQNQGEVVGERQVQVQGQRLDNQGGKIQARGDLQLALSQALDNRDGLLRSAGQLSVQTASLDNRSTAATGKGIEGQSLLLRADALDNGNGALRADQGIDLGVAGTLNNDQGLISAGGELRLADRDPAQARLRVDNGSGTLIAGRLLAINAAYFSGSGRGLSLGDLQLRQQGDLVLAGQLQANGTLDLEVGGQLSNSGQLLASKALTLRATHLDNSAQGELSATRVDLRLSGQLTNRGLIDGQQVRLQADELFNLGTGRIYGDRLAIASRHLVNRDENDRAATLAAREQLDIGTQRLDNREQALIFSAGDLAIGGALDGDDHATGRATQLSNASATVESLGDLRLAVAELRNTNEHFSTTEVQVSDEQLREYQISGSPNRYRPDEISVYNDEVDHLRTPEGVRDNFNRYDYTRSVTETRIATSAPGQILAGGDLSFSGDTVFNDKSRILAGGVLQAGAAQVTNTEVDGRRVTTDVGTATNFYRIQRKGRDRQGSNIAAYRPAPLIQDIDLTPTEYGEHATINGSGTQIAGRAQQQVGQQVATVGAVDTQVAQQNRVGAVVSVKLADGKGVADQVRSGGLNLALPSNSLFQTNPETTRGYLIETDPRFTSYRTWLSSDYMLDRLQLDPALTQQRLGDGFYEQRLIREQVAQLTGRRFIDGFANDESQYRALIDNAVTVASSWNLVPGVALTSEQMAQLTSDIVWLVSRDVTLPNGQTRQVLVPQVYVRVRDGDLDGNGALIAGQQLRLDLSGDLLNSGSLGGRSVVALTAQNIDNLGGRIQGNNVALQIRDNLNNLGGLIGASDSLALKAGQDINVRSLTQDSVSEQGSRTAVSRVAGLFVSGEGGTMRVAAGRDLNLAGAQVVNAGAGGVSQLEAGRDVNLGTVAEQHQQAISWNSSNWRNEASRGEVGSTVQSTGDLHIQAGQDIAARGATVASDQGMVMAQAGRDIALSAAEQYQFADEAHKFKGKSGLLSSKTTTLRDTVSQTQAQGSTVSAEQTYLQAGRDIGVRGSDVVSTQQTVLAADRDINVEAASQSASERHDKSVKKSGLFSGGGLALTIGTQQQSVKDLTTRETARASTVGSTEGDVLIDAGRQYRQVGSDVMAPKGDVDILAQQIAITEARELTDRTHETRFKQTGFTVTITNPVISAIQTTQQMQRAAGKTEDGRMQALAASTAALAVNNAATSVAQDPGAAGGVNISLSLGTKQQESTTVQHNDTAAGSKVVAGNDVRLRATGAGRDSDITVQGSEVRAGRDATLAADGDINLLAARNTSQQDSDSKGSSASVGIGLSLGGSRNGFTLDLGVSGNRGEADGDTLTHSNARVEAGNRATLISGGDSNLRGAVVSGREVLADVGGDLNIESLQDTDTFKVDEKSMGFGLSLCIPPFCYGMSSVSGGSANLGGTDMDSDFASVTEQSGIKAGDGGFDVRVAGNTDLKGAVIASSDKAVAEGKNRLETGSLTTSDIRNKAEYDASTFNIGGGYSEIGKDQDGKVQTGGAITPGTEIPTNDKQIGASLPIAISASDSASSVTRSGISGASLLITDAAAQRERTGQSVEQTLAGLNREVSSDRDDTNALKPIFDEEQIRSGFEIVNAFANEAGTLLANKAKEVDDKRKEADAADAKALETSDAELSQALRDQAIRLRNEADGVAGNWGAGGTYRQITTALVAAASGNISAGNGAFLQGMVVNYVQQQGAGYLGDLVADGTLVEGTPMHAALHGILACAGAAASSQSCGSGAAGAAASSLLTGLFSEASPTESEREREAKRNLIVSLVTGLAATTSLDAATATAAASGAVDNNWLATQQYVQARKELKEAEGRIDELKVLAKWAYISKKQDLLTQSGVGQGLIKAGFDDISGLAQMLLHPVETVKAIGGLIDDPSALAGYPAEVKQNIKDKVARIENALTVGGDANAEQMGYDIGELVWDVGGLVTGVGGVAKGGVKLASVGIKLSTKKLEQMAERQIVKNLEWQAGKGEYTAKLGGGYGSPSTVTHNGQVVENAGDFSGSLPKPAGKGEGGAGAKEPGQANPDIVDPPKFSSIEDLFGQTFESIPLSHLPNWKTGSLVNDGKLGEQLAVQVLNEKTGLNFKPLQNSSNHGCDGCAVAINGDTITVVVMDAKSSVNGVNKAATPHGDPATRLRGWLGNSSIADSDPALRDALRAALLSENAKVQGVTVKVGVPAAGRTGVAEFKVEPWSKK
ncbi:hemagglutinin repeat-containing protein [Pseudomonas sp. S75]|uniref:two-partner secretion domain-containing protein n=1 Tax=unclassified Pseudomonas TaxID=196821 RepID=UPI001904CD4A|nr:MULTISPECIES: hemagglutinin repeat-containing protein [unclassified Pseudomonas]MBJ9977590.1 hemagglutinin repeat-containing protein [Pseudomonas sp. S30]MBK0155254.1 hemagglutinin repeat-containing protein [Pseudomonas sp. S75]